LLLLVLFCLIHQRLNHPESFWCNVLKLGWVVGYSSCRHWLRARERLMLIHAVIHLLSEQWLLKLSYLKTRSLLLLVHTLTSLRRTAHFLVMTETLLF